MTYYIKNDFVFIIDGDGKPSEGAVEMTEKEVADYVANSELIMEKVRSDALQAMDDRKGKIRSLEAQLKLKDGELEELFG